MSFFLPQPLQAAVSDRKMFPAPGQLHSTLVNSYGTWYNKFYCIAPEKPRCASQCARRHPGAQPETALFSSGPCLKNVNIPKRRVFFRHTALIFLAIHKVLPRQIALSGEKSLTVGHISNFQTRPSFSISKRYLAMGALTGLLHHMDWLSMLLFVMSGVACLICLTVHGLPHGLAAYKLGAPPPSSTGGSP